MKTKDYLALGISLVFSAVTGLIANTKGYNEGLGDGNEIGQNSANRIAGAHAQELENIIKLKNKQIDSLEKESRGRLRPKEFALKFDKSNVIKDTNSETKLVIINENKVITGIVESGKTIKENWVEATVYKNLGDLMELQNGEKRLFLIHEDANALKKEHIYVLKGKFSPDKFGERTELYGYSELSAVDINKDNKRDTSSLKKDSNTQISIDSVKNISDSNKQKNL